MPYALSDSDVQLLRDLVREEMSRRENGQSRTGRGTPSSSPDVYMARTPPAGVPGLATAVGTGTGDPSSDSPGEAECDVWQILPAETALDSVEMMVVDGLTETVYNFSTDAIPGETWVKISRDKWGCWVADLGSGGGVDETGDKIVDHVHVVVTAATGTGTTSPSIWYCERVTLPSAGGWPPVADPTVTYHGITESENRLPRMEDAAGGAVSHIIPLFEDRNGNRYIVFWKTHTSKTITVPTDPSTWTFNFNTATCQMTVTAGTTTYTVSLDVTPSGDSSTGLTLNIA